MKNRFLMANFLALVVFLGDGNANSIKFFGNSITLHYKAEKIGWNLNNGMAATSADLDYVGLIMGEVMDKCHIYKYDVYNFSSFERNPSLLFPANFYEIDFKDNILVFFLGDNVKIKMEESFVNIFEMEIKKIKPKEIIVVGTWWGNDKLDNYLRHMAENNNIKYVDISGISKSIENRATHPNKFVSAHPGNIGMKKIANKILPYILAQCI